MKANTTITIKISFDLGDETMETLKAKIENDVGAFIEFYRKEEADKKEFFFFPNGSLADVKTLNCDIVLNEVK
jgi:hypothetical protein